MSVEFVPGDLGDIRLDDRLTEIAERLGRSPTVSNPAVSSNWAGTQAASRFCDNETVDPRDVLTGYVETDADRVKDLDELLVVSDTTYFTFPRHLSKEGHGDIGHSNNDVKGVKLHNTIGVDPERGDHVIRIEWREVIAQGDLPPLHDVKAHPNAVVIVFAQRVQVLQQFFLLVDRFKEPLGLTLLGRIRMSDQVITELLGISAGAVGGDGTPSRRISQLAH